MHEANLHLVSSHTSSILCRLQEPSLNNLCKVLLLMVLLLQTEISITVSCCEARIHEKRKSIGVTLVKVSVSHLYLTPILHGYGHIRILGVSNFFFLNTRYGLDTTF